MGFGLPPAGIKSGSASTNPHVENTKTAQAFVPNALFCGTIFNLGKPLDGTREERDGYLGHSALEGMEPHGFHYHFVQVPG